MIYGDKYYVLDAKYYRYGVFPDLGPSALPHSSDINKQITYADFVKNKQNTNIRDYVMMINPNLASKLN